MYGCWTAILIFNLSTSSESVIADPRKLWSSSACLSFLRLLLELQSCVMYKLPDFSVHFGPDTKPYTDGILSQIATLCVLPLIHIFISMRASKWSLESGNFRKPEILSSTMQSFHLASLDKLCLGRGVGVPTIHSLSVNTQKTYCG
jgi:hypothetical protein